MKIIVTGSLGNISQPLTQILIGQGHDVTVVSSDYKKQAAIESMGATAAIGSISDVAFLVNTFKGADAVYAMIPLSFTVYTPEHGNPPFRFMVTPHSGDGNPTCKAAC